MLCENEIGASKQTSDGWRTQEVVKHSYVGLC